MKDNKGTPEKYILTKHALLLRKEKIVNFKSKLKHEHHFFNPPDWYIDAFLSLEKFDPVS